MIGQVTPQTMCQQPFAAESKGAIVYEWYILREHSGSGLSTQTPENVVCPLHLRHITQWQPVHCQHEQTKQTVQCLLEQHCMLSCLIPSYVGTAAQQGHWKLISSLCTYKTSRRKQGVVRRGLSYPTTSLLEVVPGPFVGPSVCRKEYHMGGCECLACLSRTSLVQHRHS